MTTSFHTEHVLPTSEARKQLTGIVSEFRAAGAGAGITVFGSHRKPEAAVVPIEIVAALADQIEDLVVQSRTRQRLADDDGQRYDFDEVAASLGLD